jgi:hypothetical protein
MFDTQKHYDEYKKIRGIIQLLPYESQTHLKNMLMTLEQLVLHIHVEQVTCKQRRKMTNDYAQLVGLYEKHKENLEQHLVLAVLSV